MKGEKFRLCGLRKDGRAVSPAISTVILTSAVVVMLLVTIVFANNFLNERMAENEFSAIKQFMHTVGLQTDDVAWIIGRTQTIRYVSRFGHVSFEAGALTYNVHVNNNPVSSFSYTVGILLFNMPIDRYNLGNDYHEAIFPVDRSFLQRGTSAPISHVFVVEKLPMSDGSYIRVVVAPSIRILNSTISIIGVEKHYYKFYLPILSQTGHPHRSQSVTLMGNGVSVATAGSVNNVTIRVGFPKFGFDNDFFRFSSIEETVTVPEGSVVEFYTGEVIVSLGLHV